MSVAASAPADVGLRRLWRIAVVVFAAQLTAMLAWSHLLWSRFSLTFDYAVYAQGWWKLSHWHLNPYDSVAHYGFWQDHSVLLMWPLALILHFCFGGFTPLVVQDLALVAAEAISLRWAIELLRERGLQLPMPPWTIGAITLTLLAANPWLYWAASFDVHLDASLPAPFLVLALRALYYRRYRQLSVWVVLLLLCGDVATTLVVAVGLAGLLVSIRPERRRLRASGALMIAGATSYVLISHLGGNAGSGAGLQSLANGSIGQGSELGNSVQILLHPWRLFFAPFHHLRNVWALLSAAGPLGLLSPWGLPTTALIAMENTAYNSGGFSPDAAQYAAAWAPLSVAGVLAMRAFSGRKWARRLAGAVLVLSMVNTIGWAVAWLPHISEQWLTVNSGAARVLDEARTTIPADAEVIASQGVVGGFASRDDLHPLPGPNGSSFIMPVERSSVYFVILPYQGLERIQVNQALALLNELSGPMHAQLVLHGYDVWVFKWTPPTAQIGYTVDLSAGLDATTVPAWATRSSVGRPQLLGPPRDWGMITVSRLGGYVMDGAYFREPPGDYNLQVRLSTSGTANIEAWNATGDSLISRRVLPETDGTLTVDVPVEVARTYPVEAYKGRLLFRETPIPPPSRNAIEGRIYLPPGTAATVYSVRLVPVAG
ncbi:MAG TPA: hypothetical protein VHV76_02840 [Mycobacteriales bacterium]|nr:hypothetical protein [Mycobacteriales bacterium]